jgi:hypothetical protein
VLKQIEIWSPRLVERDDFTINDSILGEIGEGLDDVRVLSIERFPIFGEET